MKFFSSDFHYGHKNIVRGTSEWDDVSRCRNFETMEEHNQTLVNNINKTVGPDDELYFLGDWAFGGFKNIWDFRDQINCNNINFILGNHDGHIRKNKKNPPDPRFATSLFNEVVGYKELKIGKHLLVMSHYPMISWNNAFKGSIHLHGHCHGNLVKHKEFDNPEWVGDNLFIHSHRIMDIGVDTHPEFRPYSLDEILDLMLPKKILLGVDHHTQNTQN